MAATSIFARIGFGLSLGLFADSRLGGSDSATIDIKGLGFSVREMTP